MDYRPEEMNDAEMGREEECCMKQAIRFVGFDAVIVAFDEGTYLPDDDATKILVSNLNKDGKYGTGWVAEDQYFRYSYQDC